MHILHTQHDEKKYSAPTLKYASSLLSLCIIFYPSIFILSRVYFPYFFYFFFLFLSAFPEILAPCLIFIFCAFLSLLWPPSSCSDLDINPTRHLEGCLNSGNASRGERAEGRGGSLGELWLKVHRFIFCKIIFTLKIYKTWNIVLQ